MRVSKRIGLLLGALLLGLSLAAPVWSQDPEPEEPAAPFVGELVELAWRYAQQELVDIGPLERARAQHELRVGVAAQAGEMKRLGYGETEIAQAVMAAVRAAVHAAVQQRKSLAAGGASGDAAGLGEALRSQLQSQLQTQLRLADCEGVQQQDRDRDQTRTGRPIVAGPPGGGAGGPGSGNGGL